MVDMDGIKKSVKAELQPKKLVRTAFVPQFGGIANPLKEVFGVFVALLGQLFVQANLLTKAHPAITGEIKGFSAIWQMINDASANLKFKRENIYQIVVFYSIVGMLVFGVLGTITFVMHLGIGHAHAQSSTSMFNDTKVASTWIDQMFPVQGGGSGVAAALGPMILAYNSCVLALATFVALWALISFVMDSAHHGEMGGKRHSELWYPIRTVFALGMLVPINNYNTIQIATVALAHAGSGMADYVWTQFETNFLNSANAPTNTYMGDSDLNEFLSQLMIISTCEEAAKVLVPGTTTAPSQPIPNVEGTLIKNYTVTFDVGDQKGFCGSITLPVPDQNLAPGTQNVYTTAYNSFYPSIATKADCIVAQTIPPSPGGNNSAAAGACNFNTQTPLNYNWQTDIVSPMQSAVNLAAQNLLSNAGSTQISNTLQTNGAADGWVDAGAIFIQLAKIASNNANAQKREFGATLPDSSILPPTVNGGTPCDQKVYENSKSGIANSKAGSEMCLAISKMKGDMNSKLNVAGNPNVSLVTDTLKSIPNPVKVVFDKIISLTGIKAFFTFFTGLFSTSQASQAGSYGTTILNVVNFGNFVMNLEAGLALAIIVVGALPFIGLGGALFAFFLTLLFFPVAVLLAIYVPLMPAMRFIFGILTWLLTIFEALVAMPIVMLVHLKSDGEGLWAHGQQGYYMILQMMLRPVLMIFGLVGAILLFDTLANFAGYSILKTWLSLASSGGTGTGGITGAANAASNFAINSLSELLPFLGFVMVYGYLLYAIANVSFKLINDVPDRILTWIGAQSGIHTSDQTSDVAQNSRASVDTALGVAGTGAKELVGGKMLNIASSNVANAQSPEAKEKAEGKLQTIQSLMPGGHLTNQLTHGAAGRYAEGSGPRDSTSNNDNKSNQPGAKGEKGDQGTQGGQGAAGTPGAPGPQGSETSNSEPSQSSGPQDTTGGQQDGSQNNLPPPPDSM